MGPRGDSSDNGAEAWSLFETGTYPLVVTDWMMPEMDGPELIRRIRACPAPGYVYVILLTAHTQKADVVHGMEAGADDFVTKPFDREELRGPRTCRGAHCVAGADAGRPEHRLARGAGGPGAERETGQPRSPGGRHGPRDQQPGCLRHQQSRRPAP